MRQEGSRATEWSSCCLPLLPRGAVDLNHPALEQRRIPQHLNIGHPEEEAQAGSTRNYFWTHTIAQELSLSGLNFPPTHPGTRTIRHSLGHICTVRAKLDSGREWRSTAAETGTLRGSGVSVWTSLPLLRTGERLLVTASMMAVLHPAT